MIVEMKDQCWQVLKFMPKLSWIFESRIARNLVTETTINFRRLIVGFYRKVYNGQYLFVDGEILKD